MENKIAYNTKTYDEYLSTIVDIARRYYPDLFSSFNDASIGEWLMTVVSDVADTLMFNIDKNYQETSVDSANQRKSLLQLAVNNGVKVPGPKAAIVEVELSCDLPMNPSSDPASVDDISMADEHYAPVLKKGCLFTNGSATFELTEDVDFSKQFNSKGISDRKFKALRDSNGNITGYRYSKLAIASASQTKIFKKIINPSDVTPFMEILLQDNNVIGVDSIILKQGRQLSTDPSREEYFVDRESYEGKDGNPMKRFFEVENLIDQYRFGYEENDLSISEDGDMIYYNPVWETIDAVEVEEGVFEPVRIAMNGKWKRVKNKFVTEFTESGYLKITFGSGLLNQYGNIPTNASEFTQYMMSRMEANDYMGVLPEPNTTMFIRYRVGGGEISNIAEGSLNTISFLNAFVPGDCYNSNDDTYKSAVINSITVTNTSMSYGGKDAPSNEELRNIIKYHKAAQNRCVTLSDYTAKLYDLDPRYGTPFRFCTMEENNKVNIYTLGLRYDGRLTNLLSETVADNMKEYLSKFKMINDAVEIRSGKVINVSFVCDVFIDKTYDQGAVSKDIIETIRDYMDVRKHQMGEDIFIGDLEKVISQLDGVLNLIELRCYNNVGDDYSEDASSQEMIDPSLCTFDQTYYAENNGTQIDLKKSDKMLYAEANSMFEIKYPENGDIVVNVKTR